MIYGYGWYGIFTDNALSARNFVQEALGGKLIHETRDFWVFDLPSGDRIEVFGPEGPRPDYLKNFDGTVLGFLVSDMDLAKRQVQDQGCVLLGETEGNSTYQWQHFRAPDGRIFELTYHPKRLMPQSSR